MIAKAKGLDKQEVYQIWKNAFANDDGGYTDFYFKTYYKNEDTFVKKIEDEIVGCVIKHPHTVMLHHRLLRCSMILGMAVKPAFQKCGIMRDMMEVLLDEIDHQELITMIQAYDPSLYEPFGFKTVYSRRIWTINRNEVKRIRPAITLTLIPKDCLQVYGLFVSRFNGYVVRDLYYFECLMKEVESENGKMIAYYNSENQIEGYATIYLERNQLIIRECIYLNSTALNHLVNYALSLMPQIQLECSSAENLGRIFKQSNYKEMDYTMVRLNNPELFNRLYNCEVKEITEAMNLDDRPLYMHENR